MKYLTRFQLTNWTSTVCYVGENLRFERISRTMILFEKKGGYFQFPFDKRFIQLETFAFKI